MRSPRSSEVHGRCSPLRSCCASWPGPARPTGHDETSAHWVARYTFAQTGRHVVNDVRARFVIRDDLIADHVDAFSFWKWSRQALGPAGLALGWTPLLRSRVRATARDGLDQFMRR